MKTDHRLYDNSLTLFYFSL